MGLFVQMHRSLVSVTRTGYLLPVGLVLSTDI